MPGASGRVYTPTIDYDRDRWILIFLAFLLGTAKWTSPVVSLIIAVLGGFTGGLAFLFAATARQLPLWVRYTTLRDPEFQKRLDELTHGDGSSRRCL